MKSALETETSRAEPEPAPPRPRGVESLERPAAAPDAGKRDDEPGPGRRLLRVVLDGLRLCLVGVFFYVFFFHLSVVRGSSMAPDIQDGDRILIEPWSYLLGGVERGDVVVLRYPLDPSVDYIKRVIGLPGDQVTLADGHVWVNGELFDEPYVSHLDRGSYLSTVVAPDAYFVLGDNRPRSSDSREFGLVPADHLRGRVDLRLWPLARAGWIR